MSTLRICLVSLMLLGTIASSAPAANQTKAGSDKKDRSGPPLTPRDFGLRDYVYLSKDLPHAEKDTWTLVGQLPHNAQFQLWLEVEAPAGQVITLDSSNPLAKWTQPVQRYTTVAGVQTYEAPGWVSGEGAVYTIPGGVTVRRVQYRETGFDADFAGSFECNDEDYNVLWQKATRTCYLCMRDHFMDCPDRERTPLCLGDVCIQIEQVFYAFDTRSHELARRAILTNPNYTHIIDQNLMFAGEYGTWFYYLNTGDLATIRTQYPNLRTYLERWPIGEDGLPVHNTKGWDWCDWGSPAKDRHVTQCCQYYSTLMACRKMAEATGNTQDLPAYDAKLDSIRTHFDRVYWRGGYYQSADVNYPDERANAMAVVTGLADKTKWPAIYENVLSKKLNPNWEGGNTYNASSYFERWVMEALCRMGKQEFALLRMYDRYQDQIRAHTTTLWEHFGRWWQTKFDANSSQNHGWNSPNTILSKYIAGIAPEAPAWSTYHVLPKEAFLTSIRVVVPTVKGNVTVQMKKNTAQYSLSLTSPAGTKAIVGIPLGSLSRLDAIQVNGTTIWKGTYEGSVAGIAWHGQDSEYVQFEAEPGTWTFTAAGVLPIASPKPPRAPQPRETPLDKKAWKVSASVTHTGPKLSYGWGKKAGGSAFDAIDGDYWTSWSTGTKQQAGQWFAIDLGRAQTFHKVVLENGWAPYDSPRRYNLYVSDDGENWGQPVATGPGSQSITEITFEPQTKRYLRLEQTGSDSFYWWSIFEVNVY